MDIKIDYREKKRVKKSQKYYESKNHKTSIESLDTGDYLFDDKVVFEYKNYPDLFSSIIDGRLFDESHRQAEKYPWHYVIIVGTDKQRKDALYKLYLLKVRFSIKQYYGAIASLNTYTRVIYAPNMKKAFQIMECQARKCLDGKIRTRKPIVKTKNPAFNLLMFLSDVSEHRAKLIVNKLKLKNYDDLKKVTYDDLINIKGIGEKTAETIILELNNYGLQ